MSCKTSKKLGLQSTSNSNVTCYVVDDLEKTKDPQVHSSGSSDPQIQSSPSVDAPSNSSQSVMSTGRAASAAKNDVMNYLEKVDVDARLGDIDQVSFAILS